MTEIPIRLRLRCSGLCAVHCKAEDRDAMSPRIEPTPGGAALDDLRFELKQGDFYEQHLASRIEDGLDAQTEAWLAYLARDEYRGAIVEILTVFDDDPRMTEDLFADPGQRTAEDEALVRIREIARAVLEGRRGPAKPVTR